MDIKTGNCSKCGISVIIIDNKIITPCKCNAAITVDIKAVAKGAGKVLG